MEKLVLDSPNQVRTCEAKANGEIRGIHFEGLAAGSMAGVLDPVIKNDGVAGCGEEVQILGGCGGKIYEPAKLRVNDGGLRM